MSVKIKKERRIWGKRMSLVPIDPYAEGYDAFLARNHINPYTSNPVHSELWKRGYEEALNFCKLPVFPILRSL